MSEERPFPGVGAALALTLGAGLGVTLAARLAGGWMSPGASAGVGLVLGFGVMGLLAAARIPPPHGDRLGLRPLAPRRAAALLLLLPAVLLLSELDNLLRAGLSPSEVESLEQQRRAWVAPVGPLAHVETWVVAVGLAPVIEEWFFRGLLQQGLVARLGAPLGVAVTALLFASLHGGGASSVTSWLAGLGVAFLWGLLLGVVRLRSGSLPASMAFHAAVNALQIGSVLFAAALPIPGFNAPGAHTPLLFLAPAALSVAAGLWWLRSDPDEPAP